MKTNVLEVDFCVIGGGMAGVSAALAAARNGAKVVLVQNRSMLGGNASSEIKMHIVGADGHGSRPGTRETGIMEELRLEDAYRNPQRSFSMWDLLLYEKIKENPNITLLLDSEFVDCTTEKTDNGFRIVSADVLRNSTEDRFEIRADYFADCSGDGLLGAKAGADFRVGRESKDEYGESLALDQADRQTLGSSILFTAKKYPTPQPFLAPSWVRRFQKHEFKFRPPGGNYEYGHWWFEWGGQLDTIKDNETIRHELFRIALGVWDYIKNSGEYPDSENWALEWVGAVPGKRESRRFLGRHILTQQDIESGRIFEDQVAYGGWPLDLHPPTGVDAIDEPPCVQHHVKWLYSIPLRSLYSRNVSNLFFAGRNISATHVAFASTRVMATCSVMGQAVGTAVAVCKKRANGNPCISQACTPAIIHEIQQTLLKDDAFLLTIKNEDKADMAKGATCLASSQTQNSPASSVLSGIARPISKEWGEWAAEQTHYWESETLPAYLDLDLGKSFPLSEIRLTFCSGLNRELILSPADSTLKRCIRGPQPEIIRDYNLYVDGAKIKSVRGNIQRLNIHHLAKDVKGQKIRVEILATNGLSSARIQEIRVYGKTI